MRKPSAYSKDTKPRRAIPVWAIGQRVGFMRYPFCYGKVVKVKRRRITARVTDKVYRVEWDIPQYGTSDWLGFDDLLEESAHKEEL